MSVNITSAVALNASTSTTVLAARAGRTSATFSVLSGTVWLKEQTAATDNDKKGVLLVGPQTLQMDPCNEDAEFSAIADSGTPSIYAVEHF